jgi:hypothetical protein
MREIVQSNENIEKVWMTHAHVRYRDFEIDGYNISVTVFSFCDLMCMGTLEIHDYWGNVMHYLCYHT